MAKTVYTGQEVPHIFATNPQGVARNSSGSLYCNNGTLYSYRDSAPIAAWFGDTVLINDDSYSVTTSKHQSWLRRAVHHLPTVTLPSLQQITGNFATELNAANYIAARSGEIAELREKLPRARSDWRKADIARQIAALEAACEFVWCKWAGKKSDWRNAGKVKAKADKAERVARYTRARNQLESGVETAKRMVADMRDTIEREQRPFNFQWHLETTFRNICHIDAMGARKGLGVIGETATFRDAASVMGKKWARECMALAAGIVAIAESLQPEIDAARAAFEAAERVTMAERVAKWLAGDGNVSLQGMSETLCRVKGDEVQTSKGARVPLNEALQFAALAKQCRDKGKALDLAGKQIGAYRGNSISATGDLTVGCHFIKWEAISDALARYEAGKAV